MQFEAKFFYRIDFVPARHRNVQHATGAAYGEIEIAEFEDAAAPVVMRVGNERSVVDLEQSAPRFTLKEDGSLRAVRGHGGKYYVEAGLVDDLVEKAKHPETLLTTFLFAGTEDRRSVVPRSRISEAKELWQIWRANGGLRDEMTKDDRGAAALEFLRKNASRMIAVDGVLYELCREPVFAYSAEKSKAAIVEAPRPGDARDLRHYYSSGGILAGTPFTEALKHADALMDDIGLAGPRPQFEVLDQQYTAYDGVARDVIVHVDKAVSALSEMSKGMAVSTHAGFVKLRDIAEAVDRNAPVVSRELLAACREIVDSVDDPAVSSRVDEIVKRDYFHRTDGRGQKFFDPDEDSGFALMMQRIGAYSDRRDKRGDVDAFLRHCLDRWEKRPAGADFDNGVSGRLTTVSAEGFKVQDIISEAQAHAAAIKVGMPLDFVDRAVADGSKLYRMSVKLPVKEDYRDSETRPKFGFVALVVGPGAADAGACPEVFKDPRVEHAVGDDRLIDIVDDHVRAVSARDEELEMDEAPVTVFAGGFK